MPGTNGTTKPLDLARLGRGFFDVLIEIALTSAALETAAVGLITDIKHSPPLVEIRIDGEQIDPKSVQLRITNAGVLERIQQREATCNQSS